MDFMPRGAVFCDLDKTIYPGESIRDTGAWLIGQGYLPKLTYLKIGWWLVLRKLGRLTNEEATKRGIALLTGWTETELHDRFSAAFQGATAPRLSSAARDLVTKWKQLGPVVLVTATQRLIAEPIAAALGFDEVIATELEMINGLASGRLTGPLLEGTAKNQAVTVWAKAHQIDLAASWAVGATLEDVPLLSLTGHGMVVNPSPEVRLLANQAHWEIVELPRS